MLANDFGYEIAAEDFEQELRRPIETAPLSGSIRRQ